MLDERTPKKSPDWPVLLFFLLGVLVRAVDLKRPLRGLYAWNESYYSIIAVNFSHYGWKMQVGPDGPLFTSNPLVPWMIAASFHRFGISEWAARLPFFLLSVLSLAALYGIARALYPHRPAVARWGLLAAATMPGLVFFSRNIQLDGPMTACGLLALWTALLSRRRLPWLGVSVIAMALCIAFKYTGALALPAWWLALGLSPRRNGTRDWAKGAILSIIAALPGAMLAAWVTSLQHKSHAVVHGLTTDRYFLRFSEWHPSAFRDALLAAWATFPTHWGHILWSPVLLGLPWLWPRFRAALPRHLLIPAIILPWYVQMVYPVSWVTNEYYDYFALYGVALGLGVLAAYLSERFSQSLSVKTWAFIAAAIVVSNLWDYKTIFHVTYFPYDIVHERVPFESAKLVNQRNTTHAPVLCEQSETMFYAGADPAYIKWIWWANDEPGFVEAVRSGRYRFVTVEYLPPVSIAQALQQSGYRQIAPGAWEKVS